MGWVAQPIRITFTWQDDDGTTAKTDIYCAAHLLSSANALALAYIAYTSALSTCRVVSYEISSVQVLVDTGTIAFPGATNTTAGVFIFDTTEDTLALIAIPGFRSEYLATEGDYAGVEIDTTVGAVADWLDLVANGYSGVQVQSPLEEDLTALSVAYLQYR